MNIEGAEYDVIKDLVHSGLSERMDGFFGMWDDLSKIDIERDDDFRAFLLRNRIQTFPFNGRDLEHAFRKKCILYHVHTCILKALSKQK